MTLRVLEFEDAPAYFMAVDESRAHLSQYGDPTAVKYPDLLSVGKSISNPQDPSKLRMAIWDDEQLVGSINLTPRNNGSDAEIGYWLAEKAIGKGYATAATNALACYANDHFRRVYAQTHVDNKASQHVLERAGFTLVAISMGKVSFELLNA